MDRAVEAADARSRCLRALAGSGASLSRDSCRGLPPRGVLPIASYLDWARTQAGAERFWLLPTLCWLSSSDAFLHFLCAGGAVASLAVALGFAPAVGLAVAWVFYLSLTVAGQVFLEFQWDLLLLETGLLALFLLPPRRWRLGWGLAAPALALFLMRWLL